VKQNQIKPFQGGNSKISQYFALGNLLGYLQKKENENEK